MRAGHLLPVLVCIVILLTYGTVANRRTPFSLPQSSATQSAAATATSTAPIFRGVVDVTFVDAQRGWMLSDYQLDANNEGLTVDATTDGGQTWQIVSVLYSGPSATLNTPDPHHWTWHKLFGFIFGAYAPFNISNNPNQVTGLRFVNAQDGWAFGPDRLATHDGGRTWDKETVDDDVLTLEIANGTLWMLQATCTSDLQCKSAVRISTDNGQMWRSSVPPTKMMPWKLVAADSESAWILYDIGTPNFGILATSDSGETWRTVSVPVPENCYGPKDFAATDRQNLWYACGTSGAGALGAKHIFTSSDGGIGWQLKAKGSLPPEDDDNVTNGGAMEHLYAFSGQSAWMTLYRNSPIMTNDGGKTWLQMDYALNVGDKGHNRRLTWVDPRHLWYYSDQYLLHTNDGGSTWVCQRAAPSDLISGYMIPGVPHDYK